MKYDPVLYQIGNSWQKKVYKHMSEFLDSKGIVKFGITRGGNHYKHLLTDKDAQTNFTSPIIYQKTRDRFKLHKAGDIQRALTNTAASQPFCFNLFVYLNERKLLANSLFSTLLKKRITIQHIEIEFTPNKCDSIKGFDRKADESLGDQDGKQGTDADVSIFYHYGNREKGVLLIEFKFIEAEFSVCGSYRKKKAVREYCDTPQFYQPLVEDRKTNMKHQFLCGYNKYFNWNLTKASSVIDSEKVKSSSCCPFRFGNNQLWRNMLLAEQIAISRGCDEFAFWVFSPKENDAFLWKENNTDVKENFRSTLTQKGKEQFRIVHLEEVFKLLGSIVNEPDDIEWLVRMKDKYLIT
jgi:hypothetical protein